MSTIPVKVQWCERYPHLWLDTEQDIRDWWKSFETEQDFINDEVASTKFIEVPQEVVTNYRLAMKLLREVEQQVTEIQKENK